MLDVMRRQSLLIYSVFGFIILIFAVNFGPGSSGCTSAIRPSAYVARVDGEVVPPEVFSLTLAQRFEGMRQRAQASGIAFDNSMAERMGIRRYVVDQLVDRSLLASQSRAHGIVVTDEQLLAELRDHYGVRGLDYSTYEDHVGRVFNMSVERFEAMVRQDVANERLTHVLRDSIAVSRAELEQAYKREHERVQLRYVRLPINRDEVAEPGAAAIEALMAAEPAALQEQYDRDIQSFETPQQVRTLQIVRTLARDASEADVARAEAELAEVRKQLAQGVDFAALVEKYSQDEPSRSKGGDMGFYSRSDVAPSLAQAAFALPVDATSETSVRTPQGLHLLHKLEDKAAGRRQPDEVRPILAASVLKGRVALAKSEKAADALRSALRAGKSFASLTRAASDDALRLGGKASAASKPVGQETGWLLRTDDSIAGIGEADALLAAAFAAPGKDSLIEDNIRIDDALYVVQVKDREHADLRKLDATEHDDIAERDELEERATNRKRQRVFAAWLNYLRSHAKVDINPAYLQIPQAAAQSEPSEQG